MSQFYYTSTPGEHRWYTSSDNQTAGSEGFAHFWPALVSVDPVQRNYFSNFTRYSVKNLENGEYGNNGVIYGSANDLGPDCEGTVAGVLWDLYDDDDYTMWNPGHPGVGQPDSIWDLYDNGITNILECLTRRNTGAGHHPLNIYEFWNVWFQSPTLDNNQKLWAVYREHGTGLEMDIVAPTGSVVINNGDSITSSLIVALALSATDTLSGMAPPLAKMQFSNNNSIWTDWETYATSKTNWNLSAFGGDTMRTTKAVYVRYKDVADIQSPSFFDNIIYRDYRCGDANGNGKIEGGDATYIVAYIFRGGPAPQPLEAGDANCDGRITAGDAVHIIDFIYRSGPAPCCPS